MGVDYSCYSFLFVEGYKVKAFDQKKNEIITGVVFTFFIYYLLYSKSDTVKTYTDIAINKVKSLMNLSEIKAKVFPEAKKASEATNVPYELTTAQFILESGWGKSVPGNNPFGIKFSPKYHKASQSLMTKEFINGKMVSLPQNFAKFDSLAEAFKDHSRIVKNLAPNANKSKSADPFVWLNEIQSKPNYKYATDPGYVLKITSIINSLRK